MYQCCDCFIVFDKVGWTKDDDDKYYDCCPECGSIDYVEIRN